MPGNGKLSRQELYDKIRETSKDEYILSEMKRLGFWPKDTERPSLAEKVMQDRAKLQTKINQLAREKRLIQDPEQALKMLHKERKKAALEKREIKKREHNKNRYQRALRWYEIQKKRITYLGEQFSHGLRQVDSRLDRLETKNLPILHESKDIALAMGISVSELRFLSYSKDVCKTSHYQRFKIQKKTGGTRLISAPMPRLKRAQYWILDNVLSLVKIGDNAHGFVEDRSILTNATPHTGKKIVINMDLKNFFPTIDYRRVKGMFNSLGYSEHVATILSLLTTEPDSQEIELDKQRWHVSSGERFLPQGAPTSPYISNIICRKMDARLTGIANKYGATYTRYADDLTFSLNDLETKTLNQLLWSIRQVVRGEGFVLHPDKTRIMRAQNKQEVTGVVVNEKPSVDRKTLKKFRALLYQIDKDGPEGKQWGNGALFNSIDGYANFVAMINPEKGIPLQKRVTQLKRKHNVQVKPGKISALNRKLFRFKAGKGELPREQWWQTQPKEAPTLERTQKEIEQEKKLAEKATKKHRPKRQNISTPRSQNRTNQRHRFRGLPGDFWTAILFIVIIYWLAKLFGS